MSSRERLTAALRRQAVDRLPWTTDITYYNSAMQAQGRFDPRYEGMEGFLRQHEELGADPYFYYESASPWDTVYEGLSQESRRTGNELIRTYTLEGETLVHVQRYLPVSFCWAPTKWPVETVEDLEVLLKILRRGRLAPHMERHREMQRRWGDRGLLLLSAPRSPLAALMAEWCGVMATTFLSLDAPDLFAEVLAEIDRLNAPVFEAMVKYKPVVVHFCDNISGENVMSFWDRYMSAFYRRRIGQLHSAGIVCVIHNDGTVRGVLGKIAEVGFDGAESLTPAPVGDVEVAELRTLAGREDFILWGMIPGAAFSFTWKESQFRQYVSNLLAVVDGPAILGTADQIPPDADLSRVRIVADLLAQRGA